MNNERLDGLLAYLDRLVLLNADSYRCTEEITECIGWIREEITKEPKDTIEFNGEVYELD